jgi:uncharacterized protein (DUF433 family)
VAYERTAIDPARMGGLPCIRNRTVDDVLADYPYLDRDDVLAALEFAAAALQDRELPLVSAA